MKVKELMAILEDCDPEGDVLVSYTDISFGYICRFQGIEVDKHANGDVEIEAP